MRRAVEFEAVLRSGHRYSTRNFVFRAGANGGPHARLGIIAGRKAASRAVDRNRVKRLIREVFRKVSERVGAYDVTVQLRTNLRGEINADVRDELNKAFDAVMRRAAKSTQEQPDGQ